MLVMLLNNLKLHVVSFFVLIFIFLICYYINSEIINLILILSIIPIFLYFNLTFNFIILLPIILLFSVTFFQLDVDKSKIVIESFWFLVSGVALAFVKTFRSKGTSIINSG